MSVSVHMTVADTTSEPKTPWNVRCGAAECGHVWPVAYLPMPIDLVAKVAKGARCPLCGGSKVFCA